MFTVKICLESRPHKLLKPLEMNDNYNIFQAVSCFCYTIFYPMLCLRNKTRDLLRYFHTGWHSTAELSMNQCLRISLQVTQCLWKLPLAVTLLSSVKWFPKLLFRRFAQCLLSTSLCSSIWLHFDATVCCCCQALAHIMLVNFSLVVKLSSTFFQWQLCCCCFIQVCSLCLSCIVATTCTFVTVDSMYVTV